VLHFVVVVYQVSFFPSLSLSLSLSFSFFLLPLVTPVIKFMVEEMSWRPGCFKLGFLISEDSQKCPHVIPFSVSNLSLSVQFFQNLSSFRSAIGLFSNLIT